VAGTPFLKERTKEKIPYSPRVKPKNLNLKHLKSPKKPPKITRKTKAPALLIFAMETIGGICFKNH
jgi:hypothetical protein